MWSMKELTRSLRARQLNKFDVVMGVSGKRGNGKSTFIFKFFNSFKNKGFNPEKHQVYKRDDVMRLLGTQKFGFCGHLSPIFHSFLNVPFKFLRIEFFFICKD